MVSYLVPWLLLLFWAQYIYAQLNPFYHPIYPDITHMRKDTCFSVLKVTKSWAGPGNEAEVGSVLEPKNLDTTNFKIFHVPCRTSQNLVDYSVYTTATVPLKYQSHNTKYYQVNKASCELSRSTFQSSIALLVNILLPSVMRTRQ